MFCTENFNTPLSDREQKSALETWIKLIRSGATMKSVGCEWTDDGKNISREGRREAGMRIREKNTSSSKPRQ